MKSTSAQHHVAVVGLGAVGCTLAAAAEHAGRCQVVLCGRPGRQPSIVVERSGHPPAELRSPLLTDPSEVVEPQALVILAVKAHQTDGARSWLASLVGSGSVVAVCQNGVEHAQRLEAQVPREAVVPVVVHASAVRVGPGRVRCDGPLRLIVPACAHAALIVEAFEGDGVSVRVVEDFQTAQWRKLCLNAVAGIMAATGRPAVVFRETMFRTMAQDLAMECVQVARAEGARIGNEYAQEVVDYFVSLAPDAGSSILADRMAHRPLEWDARNGVIQRLGSRHGIPTPVSDLLVPLLAQASVVSTSSPAY